MHMQTTVIVVGTGGMARGHIQRSMLPWPEITRIAGLVEVSEDSRTETAKLFSEAGQACPPFFDSIGELLEAGIEVDTALIVTPHKFHFDNTRECLENGIDVLVEKPMVMNAEEAEALIAVRDRTARLLVVGFPGSLSPAVKTAKAMIAEGRIGRVTGIAAHVYQNWKNFTVGTWRQDPEISGGGFLFDTGSHMVNTVVDLVGEDMLEVTAIMDNCGTPVEVNSSVGGRFRSGLLFSLAGMGDATHCSSAVFVHGEDGVLQTGIWGECLKQRMADDEEFQPVDYPATSGVWEQFLEVRAGELENPCPAEVGLRFARLMGMIRESADTGRLVRA